MGKKGKVEDGEPLTPREDGEKSKYGKFKMLFVDVNWWYFLCCVKVVWH